MQHWIVWYTSMEDEEGLGDTYFGPFFTEDEADEFREKFPPEMYGTWDYAESFCVNAPYLITDHRRGRSD